jgi:hypothetical protein
MKDSDAKYSLDVVIDKARVHLYKPIQIAEILHRDRVFGDIDLSNLETYRTKSRTWRDSVSQKLLGRVCNSSVKYQDALFSQTAIPPDVLNALAQVNKLKHGIVESYIYFRFKHRHSQMSNGLIYCSEHDTHTFQLEEFIDLFWKEPGLKRSIDKIYEIVVYSLFSALLEALDVTIEVSMNSDMVDVLEEFSDFARRIINLTPNEMFYRVAARINRNGVTNAADRGLDMWSSYGLAIQIKHLSLTEELAENIVTSVSSDRIVIVCKDAEEKIIVSLLNQMGWKSKIQDVVTESDLLRWYDLALRGRHSETLGRNVLERLRNEITVEFPSTKDDELSRFIEARGYHPIGDDVWSLPTSISTD